MGQLSVSAGATRRALRHAAPVFALALLPILEKHQRDLERYRQIIKEHSS